MLRILISYIFFLTQSFSITASAGEVGSRSGVQRSPQSVENPNSPLATTIRDYLHGIQADGSRGSSYKKSWTKVRDLFTENTRYKMDRWMETQGNKPLPRIDSTSTIGADGQENISLVFTAEGESLKLTFAPSGLIKINDVKLSSKDSSSVDLLLNKGIQPLPALSKDYENLSAYQSRALKLDKVPHLLLKARELMDAAEHVREVYSLNPTSAPKTSQVGEGSLEVFAKAFLFQNVFADDIQDNIKCIVAGYITLYEQQICQPYENTVDKQKRDADINALCHGQCGTCPSGQISCNPLVYGFQSSGAINCVDGHPGQINVATKNCNAAAPIDTPAHKSALVASLAKALGGKESGNFKVDKSSGELLVEKGSLIQAQLDKLNGYVDAAMKICGTLPLSKIKNSRLDQQSACDNLGQRKIQYDLEENQAAVPPVIAKPTSPTTPSKPGATVPAGDNKKSSSWKIPALILFGVAALGGLIWAFSGHSKNKATPYVPGITPEPPTTPVPPAPPALPPPAPPAPAPTPTPTPQPNPPTTGEGDNGLQNPADTGGGVRGITE